MTTDSILSTGLIRLLVDDPVAISDICFAPVMQCLFVSPQSLKNVHYLRLSDGEHFVHCRLNSKINHLVGDGKLAEGCICRVKVFLPISTKWVIRDMEVLEQYGCLKQIGQPGAVHLGAPLTGRPMDLTRFPPEILDIIVSELDQRDKLALFCTSKQFHTLMEASFYSVVELQTTKSLIAFIDAVGRKPVICGLVRKLTLGDFCCCIDPRTCDRLFATIERLSLLRDFTFEPIHQLDSRCQSMLSTMVERVFTDKFVENLKALQFWLNVKYAPGLEEETQKHILQTVFSIPSIEHLSVVYGARELNPTNEATYALSKIQLQDVGAVLANLRSLFFQWDGLPLTSFSDLLRLPRRLDHLVIEVSGRYFGSESDTPSETSEASSESSSETPEPSDDPMMFLDAVLEPVANTLQELEVRPVDCVLEEILDYSDFYFSIKGLSSFKLLRRLRIPGEFLTVYYENNGGACWFPTSLESLTLTGCKVKEHDVAIRVIDSHPLRPRQRFMTPKPEVLNYINLLCGFLHSVPKINQLLLATESFSSRCSQILQSKLPPILLVESPAQPLIDRGVRVRVEFEPLIKGVQMEVRIRNGLESQ